MAESQNEQDAQTLFVRGITDEVDEEILFELFQNVSILINFKKKSYDKITVNVTYCNSLNNVRER